MPKWIIGADHSFAGFTVRHMMVTWVHGQFNRITGTLHFDPLNVGAASVEVEIDAAAIYTGLEQRDQHLRSPDFFDVEKYPAITFKSTGVEPAGLDHALVHGDLTLLGVTRPVVLDVRWAGPARFDDEGKIYTTFGFRAETRINREDFGMAWNTEMEYGGVMVGKHIYITLDAEADLVAAENR
jgi:polyisoprenoid-binding protein YceI